MKINSTFSWLFFVLIFLPIAHFFLAKIYVLLLKQLARFHRKKDKANVFFEEMAKKLDDHIKCIEMLLLLVVVTTMVVITFYFS